jgi:ribose transport system ATP-binding protein
VYISHLLPEVLRVSDRISVLRDGKVVTTLDEARTKAAGERDLASLMVGRPMAEHFPTRHACSGKVVLSVSNLTVPGRVQNVSFDVREGEIFGLAGLIGAGRTEAAEAIAGLRRRTSGTISLDGHEIAIVSPSDAVRHRIAYLSEDRKGLGLTLGMNLADNMTLVSLPRYSNILLSRSAQETSARTHIDRLRVRASGPRVICETLSGGNQQKVLLAKWLEIQPRVLLIDEPTRGVDIGAKEEIYRLLQQLGDQGMACVMISSEMNELLGMCHRIGVMRAGRLVEILDGQAATEELIMHAAAGVSGEAA